MQPTLTILSASFHDLRYPLHGAARLILGSLGSLARNRHRVFYLHLSGSSESFKASVDRVYVDSGEQLNSFGVLEVPTGAISHNQLKYMWVSRLSDVLDLEPDVVICEDRRIALLCRALSRELRVPWLIRVDALRCLYHKSVYAITQDPRIVLEAVPGILSYIMLTGISDAGLCVTKSFEHLLRKMMVRSVYTVEPTYMLLDSRSDTPGICSPNGIEELPEELALFSGPLEILLNLASRTPEIPYVMMGAPSYHARLTMESLGADRPNVFLLGTTKDSDQAKIYRKTRFALIARPVLTGISMKSVEVLSFAKPCITDLNTASALTGLAKSKAVLVENGYSKWHHLAKTLWNDDGLRHEMERAARSYFGSHLSPRVHSLRMERCLLNTIEGRARRQRWEPNPERMTRQTQP